MKTNIINGVAGLRMSANFEKRVNDALVYNVFTPKPINEVYISDITVGYGSFNGSKYIKSVTIEVDGKEYVFKKAIQSYNYDDFHNLEYGTKPYSDELKRIAIDLIEDYATELHS